MPSITIRNVPPEVRDKLASRAAGAGQSLQEYVLAEFIAIAELPTVAEVMARARQRTRALDAGLTTEQILAYLDEDRE